MDGGAETKAKPLTLENPKKKATAEVREAAELYYPEDPEERRKLKGAAAESKEQLKHRQTKLNELRNVISTPREYHYTSSIETTTERAQSVIGDFWTVQEPGRSKTSNRKSEGKGEEEGSKGKKKGGGKGKGKTEETTTGGAHVQKSYSYPCQCQIPFSIIEMVTGVKYIEKYVQLDVIYIDIICISNITWQYKCLLFVSATVLTDRFCASIFEPSLHALCAICSFIRSVCSQLTAQGNGPQQAHQSGVSNS